GILTFLYSFIKDLHRIIFSSATCRSFPGNQSGITDTPDIHTIFIKIVFTPLLTRHLRDSVYRSWIQYHILPYIMFGNSFTEYGDGTRPEHFFQHTFTRKFTEIKQRLYIQLPGEQRLLFRSSGEQGRQMIHCRNFVILNYLPYKLRIEYIHPFIVTCRRKVFVIAVQSRSHHIFGAMYFNKSVCELSSNLAKGTCNKDFFRV